MRHSKISRLLAGATAAALAAGGVAATGTAAHAAAQPYFSYTNGWRVDQHERELADVNGDGNADIVGFGDQGTYVALGRGDRTFGVPERKLQDFGYAQGWRVDQHERELADVNGDGHADVVGFGAAGTYVAYGRTDGGFTAPALKIRDFGSAQGWSSGRHLRVLGDVDGDGTADVVGFGDAGTHVAHGETDSTFSGQELEISGFGADGGWHESRYPRTLADVNGDGARDVVGFGHDGTYVSYGRPDRTLTRPALEVSNFGWAQGWRVDRHPRRMADVNGDGTADLVGFGDAGVHVSYGQIDGALIHPDLLVRDFGWNQGWRVDQHPRELAHANGDATADIIAFGDAGTHVAYGQPEEIFIGVSVRLHEFGRDQGWRVEHHPRELADVNGDDRAEVVGFGHSHTVVGML